MGIDTDTMVLAGASSRQARIDAISGTTGDVLSLVTFDTKYGTYAIDRLGSAVLVGNRGGRLLFTDNLPGLIGQCTIPKVLRDNGAQIIDTHLTEDGAALMCDEAGVYLWPVPDRSGCPCISLPAPSENDNVCSLNSSVGRVFGLTTSGRMLVWTTATAELDGVHIVPSPPRKAALLKLVYWPERGVFTYPSATGGLVCFHPDTHNVTELAAHDGMFYAMFQDIDGLVSIGYQDKRLKKWPNDGSFDPVAMEVPCNIIAGTAFSGIVPGVLLLDDAGTAYIGHIHQGTFQCDKQVRDTVYRCVAGTDVATLRSSATQMRLNEIHRLIGVIRQPTTDMHPDDTEQCHRELKALGVESISLELRAQQAHADSAAEPDAIVRELECRMKQSLLLGDDPDAAESLTRYAEALECVHQYDKAHDVRRRIHSIRPHTGQALEELNRKARLLADGEAVVAVDEHLPLEVLVRAGMVLGQPLLGHFAIAAFDGIDCPRAIQHPERVAEKCRGHHLAVMRDIAWLANGTDSIIPTLFAEVPVPLPNTKLRIAIPLQPGRHYVKPVLVFGIDGRCQGMANADEMALKAYKCIRDEHIADVPSGAAVEGLARALGWVECELEFEEETP